MLHHAFRCLIVVVLLAPSAGAENAAVEVVRDITYATVEGHELRLDVHRRKSAQRSPLVVWVHGGAWRRGSRSDMPLANLVQAGYAVASVDYRLSPVAKFPAQVHDIKAAIRFLRARRDEYKLDVERVAIAGSSAGGHLAALVGVTNGHVQLEGQVGSHGDQSSAVQAIVDYYGPTNLLTILDQSTPHGLSVRAPALELLLGGPPQSQPDLARLASATSHIDASDPPLLMLHGDQDPQVPINQSHELHGAYQAHKLTAHLEVVHGGAHGGKIFFDEPRMRLVTEFLDRHLRATPPR